MQSAKTIALLSVCCVVGLVHFAAADPVPTDPGNLELIPLQSPLSPILGADVDKLHGGAGGWGVNYYDDLNNNGSHDPGEPFADSSQAGWTHTRSAADNSCWLASACNMLEQAGVIPDGAALYMDYALNGVVVGGSTLTWDEGGLQEYVINQWKAQNPSQAALLNMDVRWCSNTVGYSDGMSAWEDWDPRAGVDAYLQTGWEVGIGMWPLWYQQHGGGHALTIQEILSPTGFDCTDSDRDGDWSGPGDLNTYVDATRGPTPFMGHDYYAWYNDFYDGDITVYPVGDVGYVCAIQYVPEPFSMAFLGSAFLGVVGYRLRKRRKEAK